jgi:hypothetical protein
MVDSLIHDMTSMASGYNMHNLACFGFSGQYLFIILLVNMTKVRRMFPELSYFIEIPLSFSLLIIF